MRMRLQKTVKAIKWDDKVASTLKQKGIWMEARTTQSTDPVKIGFIIEHPNFTNQEAMIQDLRKRGLPHVGDTKMASMGELVKQTVYARNEGIEGQALVLYADASIKDEWDAHMMDLMREGKTEEHAYSTGIKYVSFAFQDKVGLGVRMVNKLALDGKCVTVRGINSMAAKLRVPKENAMTETDDGEMIDDNECDEMTIAKWIKTAKDSKGKRLFAQIHPKRNDPGAWKLETTAAQLEEAEAWGRQMGERLALYTPEDQYDVAFLNASDLSQTGVTQQIRHDNTTDDAKAYLEALDAVLGFNPQDFPAMVRTDAPDRYSKVASRRTGDGRTYASVSKSDPQKRRQQQQQQQQTQQQQMQQQQQQQRQQQQRQAQPNPMEPPHLGKDVAVETQILEARKEHDEEIEKKIASKMSEQKSVFERAMDTIREQTKKCEDECKKIEEKMDTITVGFAAFSENVNARLAKQDEKIGELMVMVSALCQKEGIEIDSQTKSPRDDSARDGEMASPYKKKQRSTPTYRA